jgi:hypothetical protein
MMFSGTPAFRARRQKLDWHAAPFCASCSGWPAGTVTSNDTSHANVR